MIQRILVTLEGIKWHEENRRSNEAEAQRLHRAAVEAMGNVGRSAGRLHLLGYLPTESPANVPSPPNHRSQSI